MTGQSLTVGPLSLTAPDGWDRIDGPTGTSVFARTRRRVRSSARTSSSRRRWRPDRSTSSRPRRSRRSSRCSLERRSSASNPQSPTARQRARTEYGYDAEQTWITVRQWFAVVDGQQVHITGSCAVEDFEDLGPTFRAVVASVARTEGL